MMKIHASYDELWEIDKIRQNPRNPNKHPKEQIELLAKMIQEQGWRCPITVSKRSGLVVRGHARLEAAKLLGCKQVPIDLQDYETDEMELADMIADNKIAELAAMDTQTLKDLLQELDTGAIDMTLTGFDVQELEDLMAAIKLDDINGINDKNPKTCKCPKCGFEFEV
jgi:ParB-like chromosome segregation protein Spo0J